MQAGTVYTLYTRLEDGTEHQRSFCSPGPAFDDYVNARIAGLSNVLIRDPDGVIEAYELARRAKRRA